MFGKVKYLLNFFVTSVLTYLIRYLIRPKVLVDVSNTNLQTTILGQEIAFPICASPTGSQCLAHPDGENAVARGIVIITLLLPSQYHSFPLSLSLWQNEYMYDSQLMV